jgi:hypothetical protein
LAAFKRPERKATVNAVTQLENEWPHLLQRGLRDALAGWQSQRRVLHGFQAPAQLLRFLHAAAPEQTDPVLLALLTLASEDRLAGRFVLQAILPALKTHAARLRRGSASFEEVWELLLFYAWQAICCYPLRRRRSQVAANLVLQVLHDTTRELDRAAHWRERACPNTTLDILNLHVRWQQLTVPACAADEQLLADAVAAGVIVEDDAQLILDTRVDGVRLRLLASVLQLPYWVLVKRRERAEEALRAWLGRKEFVQEKAASVLTSGATSRSRTRPSRACTRPHDRVVRTGRPRRRAA